MNIRHYLVREQTWVNPADAFYWLIPERTEVVATFANYEGALADCRRREEEARWPANPFRYGNTMFYRSSLDAPRLHDWLLDHDIDLSDLDSRYCNDETGATAYPPAMLLKVILFAYAQGIVRSRDIERACREHVMRGRD